MIQRSITIYSLLVLLSLPVGKAFGQTTTPVQSEVAPPTAFDVTSIRPDKGNSLSRLDVSNGMLRAVNYRTSWLIQYAYGDFPRRLLRFQILGGPKWLDSEQYDILAKMDSVSSEAQKTDFRNGQTSGENLPQPAYNLKQQRVQSLLKDRFQFKAHFDIKEMPVYELVVAKNGSKLTKTSATPSTVSMLSHAIISESMSLSALAASLTASLDQGRIVQDKTGLTGNYKINIQWRPDDPQYADLPLPDILTAVQEQLGLKLVPQKGPVKVLVIDHIEKPSPN